MAVPLAFGQQGPSECKVNGTWFECWGVNSPYLVQSGPASSTTTAAKTVTATFSRLTARGNTLALACGGTQYASSNWTATVSDLQGNYWPPAAAEFAVNSTTQWAGIWIAQSTVGGTADAITLTISGTNAVNQSISCYPYELPGSSFPATPVDQISVGNNAGSTAPTTASVTTSPGIEVALTAIAAHATSGSSPMITPGNFWTLDSATVFPTTGSLAFGSESLFLTSAPTSSVAGTATLSASNAWAAAMVTIPVMKNAVHVFGGQTTNSPAVSGLGVLPCYYNSSLPTLTSGNSAYVACDPNGRALVNIFGNSGATVDAQNNASPPANVLAVGMTALATGSNPTSFTNNDIARPSMDLGGSVFVRAGSPYTFDCGLTAVGATLTLCQSAPASGFSIYVTDITACTLNQAATWKLEYSGNSCTSGSQLFPNSSATYTAPNCASSTVQLTHISFNTPLKLPAANALCVLGAATNTATIDIGGFIAP